MTTRTAGDKIPGGIVLAEAEGAGNGRTVESRRRWKAVRVRGLGVGVGAKTGSVAGVQRARGGR